MAKVPDSSRVKHCNPIDYSNCGNGASGHWNRMHHFSLSNLSLPWMFRCTGALSVMGPDKNSECL